MLTGTYDASMSETFPTAALVVTNFAHILPASTHFDISDEKQFGQKVRFYGPSILLLVQVLFVRTTMRPVPGPQ